MMIKQLIISSTLFLFSLSYAQVGIKTEKPEGLLHLQNTDSKELGLVIPNVSSAESVKTPDNMTPVEATLVYDKAKHCLRILTSENSWSGCLLDRTQLKQMLNE